MTKHFCDLCGKEIDKDAVIEYTVYKTGEDEAIAEIECCKGCDRKMKARVAALSA